MDLEEIENLPEGAITWKAKSRWVVQGYTDPDADGMQSSSPVSATRSLYLALQKAANNGWKSVFADIKTACLNQPTRITEQGPVYVKFPRDHPELPGRNCELQKDSYGVICGALRWYQTFRNFLLDDLHLTASKTDESMYLLKRNDKVHGVICVVVDDLCMVGDQTAMREVQKLKKRFSFGKRSYDTGTVCGRDIIRTEGGGFRINQQKKVSALEEIDLDKGLLDAGPADEKLIKELRSRVGQALYILRGKLRQIWPVLCQC